MSIPLLALSLLLGAQPPPGQVVTFEFVPSARSSYETMLARAGKENKVLIVGDRCAPVVPDGCLEFRGTFENDVPCIFVGVPINGTVERMPRDFPPYTAAGLVRAAVESYQRQRQRELAGSAATTAVAGEGRQEVRRAPPPFPSSSPPSSRPSAIGRGRNC